MGCHNNPETFRDLHNGIQYQLPFLTNQLEAASQNLQSGISTASKDLRTSMADVSGDFDRSMVNASQNVRDGSLYLAVAMVLVAGASLAKQYLKSRQSI